MAGMLPNNRTDKNCQSDATFGYSGGLLESENITEVLAPMKRKRFAKNNMHRGN
jgi:hypothetical protein